MFDTSKELWEMDHSRTGEGSVLSSLSKNFGEFNRLIDAEGESGPSNNVELNKLFKGVKAGIN